MESEETKRNTCSTATSSIMDAMRSYLGLNQRLCCKKPVSNCPLYGLAHAI
jgi:hypothetical protein